MWVSYTVYEFSLNDAIKSSSDIKKRLMFPDYFLFFLSELPAKDFKNQNKTKTNNKKATTMTTKDK